jgi:alpha-1,3-glucosyltransferase
MKSESFKSLFIWLFAILLRLLVGLGSYSGKSVFLKKGKNTPPLYGDFEAQRHWIEVTSFVDLKEWYFYDLPYWGLDYPPITAYISYIIGLL